jgi:hypothetical protein
MMISVTEREDGEFIMTLKVHGEKEKKILLKRVPEGFKDPNGFLYPLPKEEKH